MSSRPVLKVVTINIWNRAGPWDRRLELLRAGIAALDPDVVGLQEVMSDGTRSLADDIAEGLGYVSAFGAAKAMGGGIDFGNAVLSRWPIVSHETEAIPVPEQVEDRSLLLAEIDAPFGRLPFVVTHLSWKFHDGWIREQQVLALARAVGRRFPTRGPHLPLVLVGDFNTRPEATEIRFLTGLHALEGESFYVADCFELAGEGPGITFDARNNPYAAPTHEPPRRIDYVFVRGPDARGRGTPLAARVVLDELVDGVAPSDHYGVYAEIGF